MKKFRKNIPGGMALDVLCRLSRCLAAACVAADVDPQYDSYWTFDTHYGSTKPNEIVKLTICVRIDRAGMAEKFYEALDKNCAKQYGLHIQVVSETEYATCITGSAYSLSEDPIAALWRCYTIRREEDVDGSLLLEE